MIDSTNNDILTKIANAKDDEQIKSNDYNEYNRLENNEYNGYSNNIESKNNNLNEKYKLIKERLNNNLYYSFAQSVFDKYKYILLIVIIILLIAFIEIQIAQNISDCCYYLDKERIMKIKPPCLSLDENEYIYIYNNDSFDKSTVIEKCNIPKGYKKRSIPKHFTTYLNKPYRKIKGAFKEVFNSTTPINNLTDGIIKCYSFRNKINIPSGYVSLNSNWIMIYPAKINIKCFIANNRIMFAE